MSETKGKGKAKAAKAKPAKAKPAKAKRAKAKPGTKRRRLSPEERREELVTRGLEIFGRDDYHALSWSKLSEHAGVSRALLHHYFTDKRGYYLASIEQASAEMLKCLEPDPELREPKRTRDILERFVGFTRDNSIGYSALLRSGFAADPSFAERVDGVRDMVIDRVLTSLSVDTSHAVFRLAVRAWLAEVETLCLGWLDGVPLEVDTLIDMMMRSRDAALRSAARAAPGAEADLAAAGVRKK